MFLENFVKENKNEVCQLFSITYVSDSVMIFILY